jgi:hypothetical protein
VCSTPATVGRHTTTSRSAPTTRRAVRWLGSQRPASAKTSSAAARSVGTQRPLTDSITDSATDPALGASRVGTPAGSSVRFSSMAAGVASRRSWPAASMSPTPELAPASTCTEPPDGSSSASTGRPLVVATAASAAAAVVTPGEPLAETST